MRLREIAQLLNCGILSGEENLDTEVRCGCGADLMSDVLAFAKPGAVLLTGLTNMQTVRTADVAEIRGVVFVRGKLPDKETIELANAKGIPLLATRLPMFEACGRLYAAGLRGGSELKEETCDARGVGIHSEV